jgi:hypothetical protein
MDTGSAVSGTECREGLLRGLNEQIHEKIDNVFVEL